MEIGLVHPGLKITNPKRLNLVRGPLSARSLRLSLLLLLLLQRRRLLLIRKVRIRHVMLRRVHHHLLLMHHGHGGCGILHRHPLLLILLLLLKPLLVGVGGLGIEISSVGRLGHDLQRVSVSVRIRIRLLLRLRLLLPSLSDDEIKRETTAPVGCKGVRPGWRERESDAVEGERKKEGEKEEEIGNEKEVLL